MLAIHVDRTESGYRCVLPSASKSAISKIKIKMLSSSKSCSMAGLSMRQYSVRSIAGGEINKRSVRNRIPGYTESDIFALELGKHARVLILSQVSMALYHLEILWKIEPHPDSLDKVVIDVVSLHPLTYKVGDTPKDRGDSSDLAVPGEKSSDTSAVYPGRLAASIDVLTVSALPWDST